MQTPSLPIFHLPEDVLIPMEGLTLRHVAGPVRTTIERAIATLKFITDAGMDEETDSALSGISATLKQANDLLKACAREYECPE